MTENAKKRIDELEKQLKKHSRLYYALGRPEISDSRYDELAEELKRLELEYPEYISSDSPTQKVGAPVRDGYSKVKHAAPMLSLGSVHTEDDCRKFDHTCRRELGIEDKIGYVCEPKLDGLSVELVYENGIFVRGATRGDGRVGEDVTGNIRTIRNVPMKISGGDPPYRLAVRGEVLMHIKDFNDLNRKQMASGGDAFANPRNAAAGSLRQLDAGVTAGRRLEVYCYDILDHSGKIPASQEEMVRMLSGFGFKIPPDTRKCKDIDEAVKYHHELESKRDELDYEIDGIVVKVSSLEHQKRLGMRTTNPRWALAYKFKPRKEITRIEDIVVQVGRTGVLTPVALLQPVEVGGVTVSRATLHNMDEISRLGVKIGDYVKVERAGDVIPKITEVVDKKRSGKEKLFNMPQKCPSCGSPVKKEDVHYRCSGGLGCPAQVKESITHYTSRDAADIVGLSDKTVHQLYEEGLIKNISDIYTLNRDDLIKLEGWKEKKTDNLLEAIETSKNITLERLIFGFGIRNVGKHIAALIAAKGGTLDGVMGLSYDELMEVKEVGPEIAESVVGFFKNPTNLKEIERLLKKGVKVQGRAAAGKFAGKKIVFTGSLKTISRAEAQKLVESEGGEASSSVSSSVDMVVAGEKAGSKLDAARKKGIPVITEEEFIKLVKT